MLQGISTKCTFTFKVLVTLYLKDSVPDLGLFRSSISNECLTRSESRCLPASSGLLSLLPPAARVPSVRHSVEHMPWNIRPVMKMGFW
jgi:hypothetical protein